MDGPASDVPGATASPRLPKIVEGRLYLDLPEGTMIDAFRTAIRHLSREVFGVFDVEGTLLYAPVIGEDRSVDILGFAGSLRGRIVSHNHPLGGMLSDSDLIEAIECDMLRIEAVLRDGSVLAWNRPATGWPDRSPALQAYVTGYNRAVTVGKKRHSERKHLSLAEFRTEVLKQVNRTLGKADDFGQNALRVERSSIK